MDNEKKVVIFGLGAGVSHGGDTRGHCCEEQRWWLYPCGQLRPLAVSPFCLPALFGLKRALSLSVRGADAIMKSTRDAAQTARALRLELTPVTQSG